MGRAKNSPLTDKQEAFIDHYVICKNGTQAARLAGYQGDDKTLSVTASRDLLGNPRIKKQIAKRLEKTTMQADEILARLTDFARADMADFSDVHDLKDLKDHPLSHVVKKLKFNRKFLRGDEEGYIEYTEFELHDPKAALDTLAKYHKLLIDKVEHTGEVGVYTMSLEQWKNKQEQATKKVQETLADFENE